MTDQELAVTKARLDAALATASENVGIKFGEELFRQLRIAGHITKKQFGPIGQAVWTLDLPAYGTHFALSDWELPDDEFEVGQQ